MLTTNMKLLKELSSQPLNKLRLEDTRFIQVLVTNYSENCPTVLKVLTMLMLGKCSKVKGLNGGEFHDIFLCLSIGTRVNIYVSGSTIYPLATS
jgi:hypothetical protein